MNLENELAFSKYFFKEEPCDGGKNKNGEEEDLQKRGCFTLESVEEEKGTKREGMIRSQILGKKIIDVEANKDSITPRNGKENIVLKKEKEELSVGKRLWKKAAWKIRMMLSFQTVKEAKNTESENEENTVEEEDSENRMPGSLQPTKYSKKKVNCINMADKYIIIRILLVQKTENDI
jgi:hypothetical protein